MGRLVTAAAVATLFAVPGAPPTWGQAGAPPKPSGAVGGEVDGPTVVHSWALSPAPNALTGGGDRPNLSYEVAPGE